MAVERIGSFPDEAAYAQGLAPLVDLHSVHGRLGTLIRIQREQGHLTGTQKEEKRDLELERPQLILDLLHQSRMYSNPLGLAMELKTYPEEEILSDSLARFRFFFPNISNPEKETHIDGTLRDLRGGIITTSSEARDLAREALGPGYVEKPSYAQFIIRAGDELFDIYDRVSHTDPERAEKMMEKIFYARIVRGRKMAIPHLGYSFLFEPSVGIEPLFVQIKRGRRHFSFPITATRELFDAFPLDTWENRNHIGNLPQH